MLFDEDFFMYGEDTLLGWQLARSRKIMRVETKATVVHEGRGSSQQYLMFYEYHMARAHILLAVKAYSTPLEIPFLVVGKMMAIGTRALLRCIRARSIIPFIAFLLAWVPLKVRAA